MEKNKKIKDTNTKIEKGVYVGLAILYTLMCVVILVALCL